MLDNLTRRMASVFSGLRRKGRLTPEDVDEVLRQIRVALLEADVNLWVAKQFVRQVKERAVGEEVFASLSADQTIIKIVRDELIALLGGEAVKFGWSPSPPTVILMCGLQGSGKTTTCAKLARWLVRQGKKPMMAACDVQRPAAVKQLQVLGEQVDVPVYAQTNGALPVHIAAAALDRCRHLMLDTLIVDTAGRTTIDHELMDELAAIYGATKPTEVFLVLDATTGQEAVAVAQAFGERVPLTGAIFTKLDGDTRGGAVLSVKAATGTPVRFIGVGEATDALDTFHPDRMAGRILGMGDVLGIIEKAELAVNRDDAEALEGKIRKGQLDFNDLLTQFSTMRRMGPIRNVIKMIPGISGMVPEEALDKLEDRQLDRIEAIIRSMTPKERGNPDILNGSRRKRIAAGSGTSVEEVNALIKQMYEMRKGMKQMVKLEKRLKKRGRRR